MTSPDTTATQTEVAALLGQINATWLGGHPDAMTPFLHEEIAMMLPDFSAGVHGREAFLAGFRDFCASATVHDFKPEAIGVTVVGPVAVASYFFTVLYERGGQGYRSQGRDLWVFCRLQERWLATWRTMLELREGPIT